MPGVRDDHKTKAHLIRELRELRQRISELEQLESARKRTEEALQEREENFRALAENAADGIVIITDEGNFLYGNTKAAEITGYSVDELARLTMRDLFHPDEYKKINKRHRRRLDGHAVSAQYETEIIRKDGFRVPLEASIALTQWRGEKARIVCLRDILERKQAEEALKKSGERYRTLVESVDFGINLIDADHTIVMANAEQCKWLHKPVSELIGKKCFQEFEKREAVCPHCPAVQTIATGQPAEAETEAIRKDGSRRYVRIQTFPIFGEDGTVTAFIEVAEDITDRKQIEKALRESEEKYRELMNGMHDTAWVIDFDGHFLDVNDAAVKVLGYSREELLSMGPHDIDSSLGAETITGLIKGMPTDKLQVFETSHTTKDGKVIPVEITSSLVTYQGRDAILSIARDITQRKQMEEELRQSEERYRLLFESESDAVMVFDMETLRFEDANRAALDLYGYSKEELLRLRVPDISAEAEKTMEKVEKLRAGDPDGRRTPLRYQRKKDGTIFPVEITNGILISGGRKKVIGMLRDITERVQAEETIRRLAYHDALTGLPNRALFADRLKLAMSQAHRHQRKLAVMSLDLDRFKDVNDTLGHSVGDELLHSVGKRLTGLLRKNDTVSRMGGDEFFLLLPEIARMQDAVKIAQKVLEAFREPFVLDVHELHITTSIGVAIYPDDGEDADTLLKNADVSLYQAKQRGRNKYQLSNSAKDPQLEGDG